MEFWSFQDNIVKVYNFLDIIVHASIQPEPFGLTIIEAMACGKPVIASQAGGAAELFTHEHDALGVAPKDIKELATAIERLIDSPQLCHYLGKNAQETVRQRFNYQCLASQLGVIALGAPKD